MPRRTHSIARASSRLSRSSTVAIQTTRFRSLWIGCSTVPEMRIKLSSTQEAFCFDEHRYSLFLGGVGAGKSHAGAVKAMLQVFPNPPSLGMVVAPTYPMLRDATWRTAHDVWGPLIKTAVRNEMRMELVNGHEIIFRSADDPDRLRAINAAWLWFDEAAMCHPDTWP